MPHAPMSRIFALPLEFETIGKDGEHVSIVGDARNGPIVSFGGDDGTEKAFAIVRAVNSHDALLAAAKAAKAHLINDLEEPGRSVFWALVGAIKAAEVALANGDENKPRLSYKRETDFSTVPPPRPSPFGKRGTPPALSSDVTMNVGGPDFNEEFCRDKTFTFEVVEGGHMWRWIGIKVSGFDEDGIASVTLPKEQACYMGRGGEKLT